MAGATRTFSARWVADVLDRLQKRGEIAGLNKSRLAERYVEEGLRMDKHPGIVFRDGPTGRRAALPRGPDVWEVVMILQGARQRGEEAIVATAEFLNLHESQVRAAVRYYAAFSEEVDERIALTVDGADEAEAAWRREQTALA
jgi:hypothetical protein